MAIVDFFYDYSSPFSYLGATQASRAFAGHELRWRPILLGAVFKAVGGPTVPLLTWTPTKMRYSLVDQYRTAEHFGVPFKFASKFPQKTTTPLRATLMAPREKIEAVSLALFEVMWVNNGDLEDPAQVAAALDRLGLDGKALVAAAETPEAKEKLRLNTDEAVAKGVFGAPSFVVGSQVFWGQDRMDQARRALEGWSPRMPAELPLPSATRTA